MLKGTVWVVYGFVGLPQAVAGIEEGGKGDDN